MDFDLLYCSGKIIHKEGDAIVTGTISDTVKNNTIYFVAPSPADYRNSFSGSALPFHSKDQAFYATPNKGKVVLGDNGKFEIKITYPNSYYNGLDSELIQPHILLSYSNGEKDVTQIIELGNRIPYRDIRQQKNRNGPEFYDIKLPVRGQEQIIRESAYPKSITDQTSFWNLKPAL